MWWHTRRNQISSFGETDESIYQFSRLLAVEVCASAVVMLDTPCSEAVWRVLATHSIRHFPLHFPSRASPCAIIFQMDSTCNRWTSEGLCSMEQVSQSVSYYHIPVYVWVLNVILSYTSPLFQLATWPTNLILIDLLFCFNTRQEVQVTTLSHYALCSTLILPTGVLISPEPDQEGNKPGNMSGTRAISTTSRRELSSRFFSCKARRRRKFTPFWQKH